MNCNTKDLIYVIKCRRCEALYVGQTGDTLRARVRVHRQQIKDEKYRILNVSKHIFNCASNYDPQFYVTPILKLPSNCSKAYREEKENTCIRLIKPKLNQA